VRRRSRTHTCTRTYNCQLCRTGTCHLLIQSLHRTARLHALRDVVASPLSCRPDPTRTPEGLHGACPTTGPTHTLAPWHVLSNAPFFECAFRMRLSNAPQPYVSASALRPCASALCPAQHNAPCPFSRERVHTCTCARLAIPHAWSRRLRWMRLATNLGRLITLKTSGSSA